MRSLLLYFTAILSFLIFMMKTPVSLGADTSAPAARSAEEQWADLEAEFARLHLQNAGHLSTERLPLVGARTSATVPALPLGSDKKTDPSSGDARLEQLEKQWKEFQDKQKKDKAEAALNPSVQLHGQFQADVVYFHQDANSIDTVGDLQDGADFRRARLVAAGEAFDVFEYRCGFDFALNGRPNFLDVYLEMHDLPYLQNARVGHFFEPFCLERITQNFNVPFMERSLADTFAPARNLGCMAFDHSEDLSSTWAIGAFRTNSNDFGDNAFDGGNAVTMRGTWLPYYDEASQGRDYFHLGAAYSYRDADQDVVNPRAPPEIRLRQPPGDSQLPNFVNTGLIPASSFQLLGAEALWTRGPFSLQSEFIYVPVDQIAGPNIAFQGFYVFASYFLTGEHRPYEREYARMGRITPHANFFRVRSCDQGVQTGCGAWELTARLSYIDLNDKNIQGGRLTDFTAGINWYLNPYTRIKFNYIRAALDDPIQGDSVTDIFGTRFDFDF